MPAKQLPDIRSFHAFVEVLQRRGFRLINTHERRADFRRLDLRAPSPREGHEAGLVFSANGLEVIVWTTFVIREGRAREVDAGWVIIKDGDQARYFSHPIHRTANFLKTLLWSARVAQLRALNRPLCPVCGARMRIANGKGLKSRYWRCTRPAFHTDDQWKDWDCGLPPLALAWVKDMREKRRKYRKKLKNEGRTPGGALKRRIGWKVGKPHNVLPAR